MATPQAPSSVEGCMIKSLLSFQTIMSFITYFEQIMPLQMPWPTLGPPFPKVTFASMA